MRHRCERGTCTGSTAATESEGLAAGRRRVCWGTHQARRSSADAGVSAATSCTATNPTVRDCDSTTLPSCVAVSRSVWRPDRPAVASTRRNSAVAPAPSTASAASGGSMWASPTPSTFNVTLTSGTTPPPAAVRPTKPTRQATVMCRASQSPSRGASHWTCTAVVLPSAPTSAVPAPSWTLIAVAAAHSASTATTSTWASMTAAACDPGRWPRRVKFKDVVVFLRLEAVSVRAD